MDGKEIVSKWLEKPSGGVVIQQLIDAIDAAIARVIRERDQLWSRHLLGSDELSELHPVRVMAECAMEQARADEREACAKIAADYAQRYAWREGTHEEVVTALGKEAAGLDIAASIRARRTP